MPVKKHSLSHTLEGVGCTGQPPNAVPGISPLLRSAKESEVANSETLQNKVCGYSLDTWIFTQPWGEFSVIISRCLGLHYGTKER